MPQAIKPPTLTERVQRALRREGEAGTALLARALGAQTKAVQGVVVRGIEAGWCRLVRKQGQHGVYALTRADGSGKTKRARDCESLARGITR